MIDPRLAPFWAGRPGRRLGHRARRETAGERWVWVSSALAVLNVALFWVLVPTGRSSGSCSTRWGWRRSRSRGRSTEAGSCAGWVSGCSPSICDHAQAWPFDPSRPPWDLSPACPEQRWRHRSQHSRPPFASSRRSRTSPLAARARSCVDGRRPGPFATVWHGALRREGLRPDGGRGPLLAAVGARWGSRSPRVVPVGADSARPSTPPSPTITAAGSHSTHAPGRRGADRLRGDRPAVLPHGRRAAQRGPLRERRRPPRLAPARLPPRDERRHGEPADLARHPARLGPPPSRLRRLARQPPGRGDPVPGRHPGQPRRRLAQRRRRRGFPIERVWADAHPGDLRAPLRRRRARSPFRIYRVRPPAAGHREESRRSYEKRPTDPPARPRASTNKAESTDRAASAVRLASRRRAAQTPASRETNRCD